MQKPESDRHSDTNVDSERTADHGLAFVKPGDRPSLDPKAKKKIADANDNLDAEQGFPKRPEPLVSDAG